MSLSNKKILYPLLLLVSLIWGSTFAVVKIIAKECSPFLIVFLRTGIASFCFGIALFLLKKKYPLQKKDIPIFFLLALLGNSLFMMIQTSAMNYTYASHGSMLVVLAPIIATVIACLIGWQKLRIHILLGLGLAFFGVFFLLYPELQDGKTEGEVLFGDALIIISAVLWAAFTLLGKNVIRRYSSLAAVAYTNFFAFFQLSLFLLLDPAKLNQCTQEILNMSASAWGGISYLGVLASFYAYIIWYQGVDVIGPVKTSTFQYFNPLFGSVIAMVFLGETLSILFLVGGLMIISGVILVNRSY